MNDKNYISVKPQFNLNKTKLTYYDSILIYTNRKTYVGELVISDSLKKDGSAIIDIEEDKDFIGWLPSSSSAANDIKSKYILRKKLMDFVSE